MRRKKVSPDQLSLFAVPKKTPKVNRQPVSPVDDSLPPHVWDTRITAMQDRMRDMTSKQRVSYGAWQIDYLCQHSNNPTLEVQDKKIAKILQIKPLGFINNN